MMNQTLLGQVALGLIIGVGVSMLANVITTVFLHRALSHRALTIKKPLRFGFRVVTWITTGIRPRQWAAVHRKHHAFTDTPGDPHSPVLLGWKRVQVANVKLYRDVAKDDENTRRYAKDIPADRWDEVLFDRALVGLAIGIAILVVTFGWVTGLVAAFVHANVYLATSSAVNAIGHQFGRRPYDNGATNLQWLAWITAGEGLHNNHHAAPTSARLSHRRWEFDPGWWAICALRRLGLVKVRLSEVVVISSSKRPARTAA